MINRGKIKDMLGCDDEFLDKLFEQFIIECTESIQKINDAYLNKNWQLIRGSAHKMLSSSRILMLNKLTILLKEIEILAENRTNLEKIPSLLEQLNTEIQLIFEELKGVE